jgi:TPR repeat protein
MHLEGFGVPKNPQEASVWFKRAADRGELRAMTNLARLYERGLGVRMNDALAFSLFERAAKAGHGPAAMRLADAYGRGELGQAMDKEREAYWRARVSAWLDGRED